MQTDNQSGFNQMAVGFRSAMEEFQQTQSPAAFAPLLASLRPAADYLMKYWSRAARVVRRNPVPAAVAVVAVGFLIARMITPKEEVRR